MYASPPLGRVGQCGFGEKDVINGIRTDPCGCAYECGRAKRGDVPRVGPDTTHGMAYVGLKNGCWARKIAINTFLCPTSSTKFCGEAQIKEIVEFKEGKQKFVSGCLFFLTVCILTFALVCVRLYNLFQ
jgi:hypothetical protein